MAHPRTGTLIYKRSSGYNARIWVDVAGDDGVSRSERQWFPLDTHSVDEAGVKMRDNVRRLATGEIVANGGAVPKKPRRSKRDDESMVSYVRYLEQRLAKLEGAGGAGRPKTRKSA